jgi:O-antigen/teichoic acid export membrane protein
MRLARWHVIYVPLLFGAAGLLFLKSLLYARLFAVESFGVLNQALLVANTFAAFAAAGFQLLGHKLLPQYYTRGERDRADDLLGTAIAVFSAAALLSAVLIGVAALFDLLEDAAVAWAALLFAIAQFFFALRLIDIKSELRFVDHALLSGLRAIALLLLGAGVALLTRDVALTLIVEGTATLCLAAPLLVGARGGMIRNKALRLREESGWFRANLPAALRLLWLNGMLTLLYAIDRWAGIALLSTREYGIFALGLLVIVVFETMQAVVNVAAYPLMGRMIARGEQGRAFRFATVLTLAVVGTLAVCYAPFVMLLDLVVDRFLPQYAQAMGVIKLALIAGALRLADFYASFAILCNQEQRLAVAFGVLALFAVAAIWLAHVAGGVQFSPEQLAMVTVALTACGFLTNLAVARRAQRRAPSS